MDNPVPLARAAQMLGLALETAQILARDGVLVTARGHARARVVGREQLWACARHPRYALALLVTGRTTSDPLLRELARVAAAGRRWWGSADLAEACIITPATVRWRRAQGWGAGGWGAWGARQYWWGAAPPPWHPRETCGHEYRRLRHELGSWAAVAERVGKPVAIVRTRAYYAKRREASYHPRCPQDGA